MPNITEYFRTGYAVQINYTINSQSITNNSTNVTVKAQLVSGGSYYTISSSATKNGSLTINGTKYSFTFTANLSANQTKTLYTKTLDIPHNSDGTKTLSLSTSLGINVSLSGVYWGTVSASGNVALTTIPRTSSMSLSTSTATLGSTSVTVSISRASSSFTHKVYCKLGSYSKQVNVGSEGSVSIPFTPELTIANQLPSSTSGRATIEVQTYNGSTKIGSVTKSLTVNVPSSAVPVINGFNDSPIAAGAATSYGYVKGLSKSKLTISSVTESYGASIISYSISGGGFSSTSSSLTTGVLNTAGSTTFTAKVTDSRGRTATKTCLITVYDYDLPKITKFTVQRCTSGNVLSDDGTYLRVSAAYTFSSVNNQNGVTVAVKYKKSTATTWSDGGTIASGASKVIGGGAIAVDSSYDVAITVTDKFNNTSQSLMIPTAYAILDILKGGKGISIGKVAETSNLFDIEMNIKARQNLELAGTVNGSANLNISRGNQNPETGRNATRGHLYTYNTVASNTGQPTNYTSVIGFGRGASGSVEICGEWTSGRGLWFRSLRDTTDSWWDWTRIYTELNKPSASDVGAYSTSQWTLNSNVTGYCKMPNGTIMQWGTVTITPTAADTLTSLAITFPTTFPTACRSVQVTAHSTVPNRLTQSAANATNSGFDIYMTRTNTTNTIYFWLAIGC